MAGALLATLALSPLPAAAHGPAPAPLRILTTVDGRGDLIQTNIGLAVYRRDDLYRYVCPVSWGGLETPLSVALSANTLLLVGADGLYTSTDRGCNFTPLPSSPFPPANGTALIDDYRYQLLDAIFDHETWLTGYQIVPDASAIVHHVVLYRVDAASVPALEQLDAADPGPGYTCFGGSGVDQQQDALGAWVPGSEPQRTPPGSAFVLPAGSRIIVQVHYNLLTNPPEPDQTAFHMELADQAPHNRVKMFLTYNLGVYLPAGDPDETFLASFTNTTGANQVAFGVLPHMHSLGTHISVAVTHHDLSTSCLVDIPRWDFNWQLLYNFRADQYVNIRPGERISLRCTYDNSPANQPVVNGEQLEPRDVRWGEGSLDEMCLAFVALMQPY